MRLVSLASGLFWVAAGLGSIAALAIMSAGQSRQPPERRESATETSHRSNSASDSARMSKLAKMFGGSSPSEGKEVVRKDRGCSGDCTVGGLGRKWAALRDYSDAADCDGASTSIDFEQGCRAYAEEHAHNASAPAP